jgi:hypothetical protein
MNRREKSFPSWTGGKVLLFAMAPVLLLSQIRTPGSVRWPEVSVPSGGVFVLEGLAGAPQVAKEQADSAPFDESERACEALEAAAASASGEVETCRACLAAARCVLVKQCAAPLSAELADSHAAGHVLAARTAVALALLDRASASLREIQDDEVGIGPWNDRIDMLRAFGQVFEAIAGADSSKESDKRLLAASQKLAVYLDDSNEAVVESAKLWVGFAYRRAGRPERSLQVLRPIITAPVSARLGFLARLERCRALGETGNFAAGIALSQRLGARVDVWFVEEDAAARKKAAGTVWFVRAEVLRGWAEKLRAAGQNDRADQALSEARALADAVPPPDRRLGVSETIAGLPDWGTGSASHPADESDAGD